MDGSDFSDLVFEFSDFEMTYREERYAVPLSDRTEYVSMSAWHWNALCWIFDNTGMTPDRLYGAVEKLAEGQNFDQHLKWYIECFCESYGEALDETDGLKTIDELSSSSD